MDRKPFRILAVAGSLRQGSYNRGLLRAARTKLCQKEIHEAVNRAKRITVL